MATSLRLQQPFTFSPSRAGATQNRRIDPSPFWSYGHNYNARRRKPGNQKKPPEKVVRDVRKLPKHLIGRYQAPGVPSNPARDVMVFGRAGAGAPRRAKGGGLVTSLRGDQEIRFQADESVQKTISNTMRYNTDRAEREEYGSALAAQVRERKQREALAKERERGAELEQEEHEGEQWGKAGPGGAYWRPCAVTGQGFLDKMGYAQSADPRRRELAVRRREVAEMRGDIEELERRRTAEHREVVSSDGLELAPLLARQETGRPKKDAKTGYMKDHGLHSTDVTKHAAARGANGRAWGENREHYSNQLGGQVVEKLEVGRRSEEFENLQQEQHHKAWETFWGRPGYGAPRNSLQKENLMKMLHFQDVSQVPNHIELVTLERLPVA